MILCTRSSDGTKNFMDECKIAIAGAEMPSLMGTYSKAEVDASIQIPSNGIHIYPNRTVAEV